MENIENTQQVENVLTIDNEIKGYLLETSKWGKFLAIIGYVGMAILILVGIGVMVGFSFFSSIPSTGFPMGIVGVVYILFAVVYYFPVNYLYKFSVQIRQGLNTSNQQSLNYGFKDLKSIFKFMGILTLVVLSLYALVLVIVLPLTLLIRN